MNTQTHSERFASFLDFLRHTGSDLPASNADIAQSISAALEYFDPDEVAEDNRMLVDTLENLSFDMGVIARELGYEG